jgi:hypothetical protein
MTHWYPDNFKNVEETGDRPLLTFTVCIVTKDPLKLARRTTYYKTREDHLIVFHSFHYYKQLLHCSFHPCLSNILRV